MKKFVAITITFLGLNLWSTLAAATPQACRYAGEGELQQTWRKVRIVATNGVAIAGADTFTEALGVGQSLLEASVCTAQLQDCRLASEGIVAGVWMKHRIQMDRDVVFGADDMATALKYLSGLRRLGFCQ